jgi:1-acyl-sn-glycerol-3-phosphate acyltransferase
MRSRSLWFSFVRWTVRNLFFRPMGGITTIGEENIPLEGAMIIAPNHLSNLDPPLMACAQNRRQMAFMAKEELIRTPLMGLLVKSLGAFPVRRGEADTESIRKAISLLQEGKAVLVFPEGARGDGRRFGSVNRGVAMLAKRTGAWVLPVGIIGTEIMWPKGRKSLKRCRLKVSYGEPFRYDDLEARDDKERREVFASEIRRRIIEQCHGQGLMLKIDSDSPPQIEASHQ